ncbi:MAG: helix-turn-helix domain-containing protein, partial [bacterium]|nr:helix-turn-helix domain-containing protein [bacterium]
MPDVKQVYTIAQAAKLLHYSERTIRQMCRDGRLSGAHKLTGGRKWLIPKDSIQNKIEEPQRKTDEPRRDKTKSSLEQVPSQVASGQPGRRRLTLDATVVDRLREEHGPRKRR